MHATNLANLRHNHLFGLPSPGNERRTGRVTALTLAMMLVEIVAGALTGSMALLADGWHMGTHAGALGIALFAYRYARRHAADPRFTFGTGKVAVLGGFSSAVVLAVVAVLMVYESARRLILPAAIHFDQALLVAAIGLAVNLLSAWLLTVPRQKHPNDHQHAHDHPHNHAHDPSSDLNLRAAYLHVLADALTSVLAIVALTCGRQWGWTWMDPLMGIVGALIIARWSTGLLGATSRVLLDSDIDPGAADRIRRTIEADPDTTVADLHVWRVGPGQNAAILSLLTHTPRPPDHYRQLLRVHPDLAHVTIEVHSQATECPPDPETTPECEDGKSL